MKALAAIVALVLLTGCASQAEKLHQATVELTRQSAVGAAAAEAARSMCKNAISCSGTVTETTFHVTATGKPMAAE